MLSMGKGFAFFGAFFCLFECAMEKLRYKDDSVNSFVSGMFTSMIVAAEGKRKIIKIKKLLDQKDYSSQAWVEEHLAWLCTSSKWLICLIDFNYRII
jgi:hypothetical protein